MCANLWAKAVAKVASTGSDQQKSSAYLFLFQFFNPKIWAAAFAVITSFANKTPLLSILLMTLFVGYLFNSCWVVAGSLIHTKFESKYNRQMDQIGSIMVLACIAFLFI